MMSWHIYRRLHGVQANDSVHAPTKPFWEEASPDHCLDPVAKSNHVRSATNMFHVTMLHARAIAYAECTLSSGNMMSLHDGRVSRPSKSEGCCSFLSGGSKQASPCNSLSPMLASVHAVYLLVCAAKLVIPLFDDLQCPFPKLVCNSGWTWQRPVMPETQAELKEFCEVGSQQSAEGPATLKELINEVYHV